MPGDGTLIKAGWVEKDPQPVGTKDDACCRALAVLVSFSPPHKAASSSAPEGNVGVSLAISIWAPVSAVAVLLFVTNTFSKK